MAACTPGVVGDGVDFGVDFGGEFLVGAAGFPAGKGGVGEGPGLSVVQGLRMGEHDPPVQAVDVAVGVDRGDTGVSGLVDGGAAGCGQGEQVGAVAGRHGPDVVQPGPAEVFE